LINWFFPPFLAFQTLVLFFSFWPVRLDATSFPPLSFSVSPCSSPLCLESVARDFFPVQRITLYLTFSLRFFLHFSLQTQPVVHVSPRFPTTTRLAPSFPSTFLSLKNSHIAFFPFFGFHVLDHVCSSGGPPSML